MFLILRQIKSYILTRRRPSTYLFMGKRRITGRELFLSLIRLKEVLRNIFLMLRGGMFI